MPVYFEGKRKKVRYGRDLVEVRFGKKAKKEAFAVFSADDGSLNFYKRFGVPKAGQQFDGRTATEVYPFDENKAETPWRNGQTNSYTTVKTVNFKDVIRPVSTWSWFSGFTKMSSVDLKKLDTSNVTNMSAMFAGLESLHELDLSTFNTSKVTNMSEMFAGGYTDNSYSQNSLQTINVSSFDTSNVTTMYGMFADTSCTSLDISSFNTQKVINFDIMFSGCVYLLKCYASNNFIVNGEHLHMFRYDNKLTGGKGTTHDSLKDYEVDDTYGLDYVYARIDNPPSAPGYFTKYTPTLNGTATISKDTTGRYCICNVENAPVDAVLTYEFETTINGRVIKNNTGTNNRLDIAAGATEISCIVNDSSGRYSGTIKSNRLILVSGGN